MTETRTHTLRTEPRQQPGGTGSPNRMTGGVTDAPLPDRAIKGRGTISNRTGRFERHAAVRVDDGWDRPQDDGEEAKPKTSLQVDAARRIITRNDSPDVPFDRSINPYKGCEHGCVYCFARPTHAYLGLSPGLDFETRLFWKPDGANLLRAELAKPSYRCRPIAFGTNTDPYQPVEKSTAATRGLLSVLNECGHPYTIVTKNALVCRDTDLIAAAAADNRARVSISITTLDRDLARRMEPRTSTPEKRLEAVRKLADAGIPVGVMTAPIIPAINDQEIEEILSRAKAAGAEAAGYVMLRLPLEIKDLFEEWLEAHFPDRKDRVLSLIRQTRGGALYQSEFGKRMVGTGTYAKMIADRFAIARKRLGLNVKRDPLDCSGFTPPRKPSPQLSLL